MMNISSNSNVGEIVRENFKAAEVFAAHQIDFCCNGNRPLGEASRTAGVEPGVLIEELNQAMAVNDSDAEYLNALALDRLIDYIVDRHHAYVRNHIPVLLQNLEKIERKHSGHHPEIIEIKRLFEGSAGDLTMHLQKEEMVLFPHIKRLEAVKRGEVPYQAPSFGQVGNPVAMMMEEHQNEGERFEKIAKLSAGYTIPEDACNTFRVTYQQLADFEKDLHRHIHLENNILFPKAIELEKKMVVK